MGLNEYQKILTTFWLTLGLFGSNKISGFQLLNYINDVNEPEIPSPFGDNNGKFHKNKTLDCTCGLSKIAHLSESLSSSTVTVSPAQVPWLLLIYVQQQNDNDSSLTNPNPHRICSGTVINDRHILTAASCLVTLPNQDNETIEAGQVRVKCLLNPDECNPQPENVVVLIAAENSSEIVLSNNATYKRLEVEVVTYNVYFAYQRRFREKQDWDIAFIHLKTPLTFAPSNLSTNSLTPICLPKKYLTDEELEGVGMYTFGWLKTTQVHVSSKEKHVSYILKRYRMTFVHPKRRCQAITARNWISDRFFCTNGPPFVEAKFLEAHGAPMLVPMGLGLDGGDNEGQATVRFVQYGIVSWDLMGLLIKKKNVRISTNVSGFLQIIENFSNVIRAQWCASGGDDVEGKPEMDPDWDGGEELNEPMLAEMLPVEEWNDTTTEHRQYQDFSKCRCGWSQPPQNLGGGRIYGGSTADRSQYPWLVQLIAKFEKDEKTFCSGTIINDKIILTSASCVHRLKIPHPFSGTDLGKILQLVKPENLEVIISRHVGFEMNDTESKSVRVRMVVPHVEFRGDLCTASEYDIALIILKEPLNFKDLHGKASPICLPNTKENLLLDDGRQDGIVLGWGDVSPNVFADELQKLEIATLERAKCKALWEEMAFQTYKAFQHVPECMREKFEFVSRFCGHSLVENYTGPADGDYGGPVMIPAEGKQGSIIIQVGFVSLITYDLMREVTLRSNDKNQKAIVVYNEIQPLLPFIDYFSLVVDATWCPRQDL